MPTPTEAAPFAHMLPAGITKASYTQREFFFARHYRRRLSIYIATDKYEPDRPAPADDDPALQRAFCDYIVNGEGLDRTYFATEDQLARAILKEHWPDKRTGKPIALPYPSLGTLFKGRAAFLQDLHASLTRGPGRTAITGSALCSALYGLGGIGKTRAAVEYAWAHEQDYTALLFVIAETPEALRRNLAALAGPLVLNLPEQDATEEDVRVKAVLDWLKLHPGWLLILDNLDTAEAVKEADKLLGTLTGGRVVITSRLASFAGHFDPLELDVLGVEDAVAFLLERTDRRRHRTPNDAETAGLLANDLGGLALALEQAGAYVAKHGISFARYRDLWRENWDKVAGWSDERITKYPRAVAVTWQTSVNQLTPAGRRLLERLAWLAPEPVPDFLLDVPVPDVAGEDLRDALTNLADYSLVRRNPEHHEFSVHRLVQDATRRGLAEEEGQRSLVEALTWINAAFEGSPDDVRTWPRLDPLAPHTRAITEHAESAEISKPTARLMNDLGVLLQSKARYNDAEPLFRRALALDEKHHGHSHQEVAIDLVNLAGLLLATNRPSEAEPLYRRALVIFEKCYRHNHPYVAKVVNNLAELLRATNRLSEAEPLYRRALAIFEKCYGYDHPEVARGLNNLAQLLQATNRLSQAEPLYRRALAIDEKSYGPDHPDVAISLNNLAGLLWATNRLSEAEPMLRRAHAIDEKSHGADHPRVAIRLSNLAGLLQATNRLGEAEPLYRRALAINEKSYGTDHPNVAIDLNFLALLLRATNRLSEAEPMYRRGLVTLARFTLTTGHRHPNLHTAFSNYVQALRELGRTDEEINAALNSIWEEAAREPPP
jgi:tetratricopeptide (TPR) repeat protein